MIAILDTSWLLELYRVPGHCHDARFDHVRRETARAADAGAELCVTVPVLFEVAGHVTHAPDGHRRRALRNRFRNDVRTSIDEGAPWTIISPDRDILLRADDLVRLADRFLQTAGEAHSFADISIIDLAESLRARGGNREFKILAFDRQLEAYSAR